MARRTHAPPNDPLRADTERRAENLQRLLRETRSLHCTIQETRVQLAEKMLALRETVRAVQEQRAAARVARETVPDSSTPARSPNHEHTPGRLGPAA